MRRKRTTKKRKTKKKTTKKMKKLVDSARGWRGPWKRLEVLEGAEA